MVDQPIEENSNLSSINSNLSAFDSLDPDLQALVGDLAKRIYGGEEITFDSDLLHHTAKPLVDGLQKGYGKSLVEVEYNSPDYKALENLTKNAFKFSASKDFHILQDMTNALRDGDRVRSFDEFRAEVDKINVKYNQNWLRTEYNQAIAASQATARWQEFQDNAKAMPFLQYQAVMDSNTRPDHQRLHGVIKRIDNPFWNTHFPPLGWGCRCEVIQLPGKNHKETPDGSFQKPDVPPQFRENFGKKQQLFSDKHPYYEGVPENVKREAVVASNQYLSKNEISTTIKEQIEAIEKKGRREYKTIVIGAVANELKQHAIETIKFEANEISVTTKQLEHATREFKTNAGHALTSEELIMLPQIIDECEIYFDESHNNYWYIYRNGNRVLKYVFGKYLIKKEMLFTLITAGLIDEVNLKQAIRIK